MTDRIIKPLFHNEWVSLKQVVDPDRGINGYTYSHEERCDGRIVAVLPFRITNEAPEFLVRMEEVPCWGVARTLSAITGGWEGARIEDDAVRELEEEGGYKVRAEDLVYLGWCFGTKSTDTVYDLFSVDLTHLTQYPASGDGSLLEAQGSVVWMDAKTMLAKSYDPMLACIYTRLLVDPAVSPWVARGQW